MGGGCTGYTVDGYGCKLHREAVTQADESGYEHAVCYKHVAAAGS